MNFLFVVYCNFFWVLTKKSGIQIMKKVIGAPIEWANQFAKLLLPDLKKKKKQCYC